MLSGIPPQFSENDRDALLACDGVDDVLIGYLEAIEICDMSGLASADPAILRLRINAHLEEPVLNTRSQDALAAMIAVARKEFNEEPPLPEGDGGTVIPFPKQDTKDN